MHVDTLIFILQTALGAPAHACNTVEDSPIISTTPKLPEKWPLTLLQSHEIWRNSTYTFLSKWCNVYMRSTPCPLWHSVDTVSNDIQLSLTHCSVSCWEPSSKTWRWLCPLQTELRPFPLSIMYIWGAMRSSAHNPVTEHIDIRHTEGQFHWPTDHLYHTCNKYVYDATLLLTYVAMYIGLSILCCCSWWLLCVAHLKV